MTRCKVCGIDLRTVPEVHAVLGELYCSKDCAIKDGFDEIIRTAKDEATERYNNSVEVVSSVELGLHGPGFTSLIQYIELEYQCDYSDALSVAVKVVDALNEAVEEVLQHEQGD